MEVANHLIFKGGTSLSKAWQLINRFSEDIDLVLNREFLGFDEGLISKSQIKKLREHSCKYLTEQLIVDLENAFIKNGLSNVKLLPDESTDDDQDPISIQLYYPNVIDEYPEYVKPVIKIEIGSRSLKDPFSNKSFKSIIGELYTDKPFADDEVTIPCINPERTYLEKLFLLHEEFQRPEEKIRVDRLSRHLFDIYQIAQSEHKTKAHDETLIKSIIAHRARFNALKGVDYATHFPPNLKPIPPKQYIDSWKADYNKMQNEMIQGNSPTFDELIEAINQEVAEYNALIITPFVTV